MRITVWNVNGLRAALRKGFERHLAEIRPDVLLLQEIRVHPEQLPAEWTRQPSELIRTGLSDRDDDPEGRVTHVRIGRLEVASVYLPSGSSGPERQAHKDAWLRRFRPWATRQVQSESPVVFGGDLNIAHTERDLFYAASNRKNSGFLPHEREWFSRLLKSGWHDFVRLHAGDVDGPYSWWSNRGQARQLDRGWRIDYLLGNAAALELFQHATTHRAGGLEVSDHAPVSIDLAD